MSRKRKRSRGGRGAISRRSVLAMLTTSGVGLGAIHASGAFDVAEASRRFNLGVSDDQEALLAIDPNTNISGESGEEVELATITNEFSEELSSLEITTAEGDSVTLDSSDQPTTLSSGEQAQIFGELSCSSELGEHVTVQILADGPDNRVELARDIDVHCESADETCPHEYSGGVTLDKDTNCDVYIEAGDEADIQIQPHTTISGDVSIEAGDETDIQIKSNTTISGDVSIEAGDEADIQIQPHTTISGDVSIDAGDEADIQIQPQDDISGDVSIDAGDEADIQIQPHTPITGDVSIEAGDEADIQIKSNTTISGDVSIDAGDETNIHIHPHTTISGDVSIDAGDDVTLDTDGSTIDGNVTIDGDTRPT